MITQSSNANRLRLIIIATATVCYILSMQFGVLSFVPATCLFVLATAGWLVRESIMSLDTRPLTPIATVIAVAFTMSFAAHYLFTRVLVVDLP